MDRFEIMSVITQPNGRDDYVNDAVEFELEFHPDRRTETELRAWFDAMTDDEFADYMSANDE